MSHNKMPLSLRAASVFLAVVVVGAIYTPLVIAAARTMG